MKKKYIVILTEDERLQFCNLIAVG